MENARTILEALIGQTNEQKAIFASWGVDPYSLRRTPLGISFNVDGFLYRGQVNIWKDIDGLYNVELKDGATESGVAIEDLQRTVDYLVEYDPETYEKNVMADPFCAFMANGGTVIYI